MGEAPEHLQASPGLLPAFQPSVRAADGPAVPGEPAAGRAQPHQRRQEEPGGSHKQLVPEPLPEPAHAGAGGGADHATLASERLPAEGLRLPGAEDLQGVGVECLSRTEDYEKQSVQKQETSELYWRIP